mmetsp:Transcript_40840/g.98496  ORF Transcript_40840/g.98496 Transcript_40840/m.98496 type:complete len:344 (+) Transcript_40840:53-1084(+)
MRSFFQSAFLLLLLACLLASSLAEEEGISNEISSSDENNPDEIEPLLEEAAEMQNMNLEEEASMILSNSEDVATNELQDVPNEEDMSNNTNEQEEEEEEKKDQVEVWLPIIEVQFVCDHDIRPPSGNTTDYMLKTYENLYNQLLPDEVTATRSSLHHLERFSEMADIAPNKWYYSDCNMTSPQLLASLKVRGKGVLGNSAAPTMEIGMNEVHEGMNQLSIKEFFAHNVCTNMTDFRAYVESPRHHHQQSLYYTSHSASGPPKMAFEHVEHSLLLLCGGEDLVYYEEGPPDGGFLFFGFFVGFLMVSMIATELQKYDQRPHPLGGRRREYDEVTSTNHPEVEMV